MVQFRQCSNCGHFLILNVAIINPFHYEQSLIKSVFQA